MMRITGRTYAAKEMLKAAGFEYESKEKAWYGSKENMKELDRITTATYSRANQKLRQGLTIETIK